MRVNGGCPRWLPERKRPGDITPCAAGSVLAPLGTRPAAAIPRLWVHRDLPETEPNLILSIRVSLTQTQSEPGPLPVTTEVAPGLGSEQALLPRSPGAMARGPRGTDCLRGSPGLSAEETADPKPWWSHFCRQRASAVLGSAHLVRGHCWSPTPATRCGNPKGTGEGPVAPAFALWRPRFRPLLAGPFLSHIPVMSHKHQAEQCRVCLG